MGGRMRQARGPFHVTHPNVHLEDGVYRRTWTKRGGTEKSVMVVVKGGAMLDLPKARWKDLPTPEMGGSWEWIRPLGVGDVPEVTE